MHFDMTISIGNLVMVGTVLVALWRVGRKLEIYRIEHEILIEDYCQRNHIKLRDLPTRSKLRA